MNLRRLTGRFRSLFRLASRFHQVQLSDECCMSVAGMRSISLPAQFLSTAEELQFEFTFRWPLLRLKTCRSISAHLVWRHGPGPGRVECRLRQVGSRKRMQITLPLEAIREQSLVELELVDSSRGQQLRTFRLEVLDPARIERLMLDSLKVRHCRLWVRSRNRWHLAQGIIPDSSDFLVLELVIGGSEFADFVSPPDGFVTFGLLTGNGRIKLSQIAFTCSGRPQVIRSEPFSVRKGAVFAGPGDYQIAASLGERDLVTFSFRLVGEGELLRQVKVARLDIQAETRDGRTVSGLGTLHWTEHRAIQLSLQVETAVCAPNTLVHCSISASQGSIFSARKNSCCRSIGFPATSVSGESSWSSLLLASKNPCAFSSTPALATTKRPLQLSLFSPPSALPISKAN